MKPLLQGLKPCATQKSRSSPALSQKKNRDKDGAPGMRKLITRSCGGEER